MSIELQLITGSDITLDRKQLTIVRKFRVKGTLPYTLGGDAFDAISSAVMSLINSTYRTYGTPMGTLFWNSIQISENHYAQDYQCSVQYSPLDSQVGAYQITLDNGVGTTHVTGGTRIAGYAAPGEVEPNNGGLIGVDMETNEVRGIDIPTEQSKFSIMFRHPQAFLNKAYIDRVCRLRGHPNKDAFLWMAPGECMSQGGNFTESNTEATALYNFDTSPNRINIPFCGMVIPAKAGFDVLSPVYRTKVVAGKSSKVLQGVEIIRAPGGMEWMDYQPAFGWGAS